MLTPKEPAPPSSPPLMHQPLKAPLENNPFVLPPDGKIPKVASSASLASTVVYRIPNDDVVLHTGGLAGALTIANSNAREVAAIVTRVLDDGSVNLRLFVDGPGEYRAVSVREGTKRGEWHWPAERKIIEPVAPTPLVGNPFVLPNGTLADRRPVHASGMSTDLSYDGTVPGDDRTRRSLNPSGTLGQPSGMSPSTVRDFDYPDRSKFDPTTLTDGEIANMRARFVADGPRSENLVGVCDRALGGDQNAVNQLKAYR